MDYNPNSPHNLAAAAAFRVLPQNVQLIRLAAALAAGEASGNLRVAGMTPAGQGKPEDFGAFQWAQEAGFYASDAERGMFCHGFLSRLAASRREVKPV